MSLPSAPDRNVSGAVISRVSAFGIDKCYYLWTVWDIKKNYEQQSPPVIWSEFFSSKPGYNYQWSLSMKKRDRELTKGKFSIGVYLGLYSPEKVFINCTWRLGIFNNRKERKEQSMRKAEFVYESNSPNSINGFSEWITPEHLFNPQNGFLEDDILVIFCDIASNQVEGPSNPKEPVSVSAFTSPDGIQAPLELITDSGSKFYIDQTIVPHSNKFFINRSSYKVSHVDDEILIEFLTYLKYKQTPHLFKMTARLLYLADLFSVKDLYEMCIRSLFQRLDVNNAVLTLKIAQQYNHKGLKSLIANFIVEFPEVLESQEWVQLVKDDNKLALEVLTEITIIHISSWKFTKI